MQRAHYRYAVKSLKDALIQRGDQTCRPGHIPNDRSYMHIDTVFTQINQEPRVPTKPIVEDSLGLLCDRLRTGWR